MFKLHPELDNLSALIVHFAKGLVPLLEIAVALEDGCS
jgi:hypothetical protein